MKVKLTVELTPTLIETLSPDQLKDVIYQFLAIEAESKVKSKVNISANAEGALNAIESAKNVINDIITEKDDNLKLQSTETSKNSYEFIKNKKGKAIPIADIIALYKNGIGIQKICNQFNMNYTTVYTRLERQGIIVKKKS